MNCKVDISPQKKPKEPFNRGKPVSDDSENRNGGGGLVSIITSDTGRISLPCAEYLRLKKLQKTVRVSGEVIVEKLQQSRTKYKAAMVTLTYRDDVKWSPRQVSQYLKCVREWARRKEIFMHYVWVLELTKRGRPHYHVLFWLPKGISMPMADKQGWWKHGYTKSEWAYSPIGYLCKYTSKGVDRNSWCKLPKGGRLHGSGGYTPKMRVTRAWRLAPSWVRELIEECDGVYRKGCYWVSRATDMCIRTPFVFDAMNRELVFKGFDPPFHVSELQNPSKKKNDDWVRVRFLETVGRVKYTGYYDALDRAMSEIASCS